MGVYFGGRQIVKPGAYSVVDTSAMFPMTMGAQRAIAIIGKVDEGSTIEPKKVYWFNDPLNAQDALGQGELLAGCRIAWSPADALPGADLIAVVPLKETTEEVDDGSGGTITVTTGAEVQDWQDALDLLSNAPIAGIVVMTDSPAVRTIAYEHVQHASANRKERRAFFGHELGATKEQILAIAQSVGHRAVVVTPGMQRVLNGELTMLPSYLTACAVAGMWAGSDVMEPLTYKYISTPGLEKQYTSAEIDEFLQGGVMVIEDVPGRGRRIVQQVTAHTQDNNSVRKELSTDSLVDFMIQDLRNTMEERFIGRPGTGIMQTAMLATAESKLNSYEMAGYIVGDDTLGVPAYRNVKLRRDGSAYFLEFEASVVEPINWILITAYFKPPTA